MFRVHDTALQLIGRVPSGGSEPVAIAQWGSLFYVLNAGGNGSVVGFHLGNDGSLKQIQGSLAYLTGDLSGGSSLSIRPDGRAIAFQNSSSKR